MAGATKELRKVELQVRRRFVNALSHAANEMAREAGIEMMANTPELDRLTTAVIRAQKEVMVPFKKLLEANGVEAVEIM